jgi:uncharacterized protein involved in exopolysaccharide biosynthesis
MRPSLRDLLHILFKWKNRILFFFILMVFTSVALTILIKPVYEATSQLLVKIGRENLYLPAVPRSNQLAVNVGVDREEHINSEIQILKSRTLAEEVLTVMGPAVIWDLTGDMAIAFLDDFPRKANATPVPMDKAIEAFRESLSVDRVRKSNVIQVGFKNKDPKLAADIVNKLCDHYLERHLSIHHNSQSLRFFQSQSDLLDATLKTTENKLRRFKKRYDISSLDEERSLLLGKSNELQMSLNQTVSLQAETEIRIQQLHRQLNSTPQTILQKKEVEHHPLIISNLQSKLVDLEIKKRDLLTKYADKSRFVINIEDEIRIVKNRLAAQESKRFGKSIYGLNPNYQRVQDSLLHYQAEQEALMVRKKTQSSQMEAYRAKIENMNKIEAELDRLQQKLVVDRQNYQLYLAKFEESRIADAMDQEKMVSVNLVESAMSPVNPLFPNIKLNLFLAVFVGAFGGLSIAFLSEYFDDSFEHTEDMEQFLDTPVLGAVAYKKKQ